MNKRNVFLWVLYDFANSIVSIVFFLYFSQWLVIEHGVSDFWFNSIFIGSTILLLMVVPIAGPAADRLGVKLPFLRWSTILLFAFFLSTALVARLAPFHFIITAFLFLISNFLYLLSFTFYNAMLFDLAPQRLWGRISGWGQCGNWLGQITGLFIALIFLPAGRAATFLPAVLIFFALAMPAIFLIRESQLAAKIKINLQQDYKNFFKSFWALCLAPGMSIFLLGYFFFNDAVITAANNFPIYLQQVFAVSDRVKSFVVIGILTTSAIGALISGWIADKVGLKKTLLWVLGLWIIVLPLIALTYNFKIFTIELVAMGLLWGSTWTVARAVMTYLTPPKKLNFGFSFYTLAERFSTFVGPLSWGLITTGLLELGPTRYRLALAAMGIFVLIGLLIVRHIPSRREHAQLT